MYARQLFVLCGIIAMVCSGCGTSVRHSQLNVIAANEEVSCERAHAANVESFPVEYVWHAGTRIAGASLHEAADGLTLEGRVTAESPSMLSASRVVKIEAVQADDQVVWSTSAKINHKHTVRWNRIKSGTFTTVVPDVAGIDHFHIGVVAKRDKDVSLASKGSRDISS